MNKRLTLIIILTWCLLTIQAKDIYVSTSFHEPATEGLRFIYSYDGIKWDSIQGVFLQPKVGVQKVMRDPSIVKGPDGDPERRGHKYRMQVIPFVHEPQEQQPNTRLLGVPYH